MSRGLSSTCVMALAAACILLLSLTQTVQGAKGPPVSDPAYTDPDRPISAFVQMQFIEISKIDGVEQAFHADFYMLSSWYAELTGTNRGDGNPYTGAEDILAEDLAKNFWSPQLEFINARDEVTRLVEEPFGFGPSSGKLPPFTITDLAEYKDFVLPANYAWLTEDQRYQCDFTTPLSMQDFPFDAQFMQLLIESYWSSNQVRIVWAVPSTIAHDIIHDDIIIVGWNYKETVVLPSLLGKTTNTVGVWYGYNARFYDRLTIRAELSRQPDYYMTKIVAGVMLLVYMCVYVFALAVDEADRMMGTLQIFAGLVTFLFVASGDTPKVPYQTRLDLFMLWSFFNVAAMLVVHGTLYFWRESDIEELLEEREKMDKEELDKLHVAHGHVHPVSKADEIELGVASPSAGQTGARVYVNEPPHDGVDKPKNGAPATIWRLRHDEWSDFTIKKWFIGLHLTRKVDAIVTPSFMIIYSVGVAVIMGRKTNQPDLPYAVWNDPCYSYNGANYTPTKC